MARKKTGKKMPAVATEGVKHVRLEFPEEFHGRVRHQADRFGLSISAYIRLALTERVERDEHSEVRDG
jgi:hypothetical protein